MWIYKLICLKEDRYIDININTVHIYKTIDVLLKDHVDINKQMNPLFQNDTAWPVIIKRTIYIFCDCHSIHTLQPSSIFPTFSVHSQKTWTRTCIGLNVSSNGVLQKIRLLFCTRSIVSNFFKHIILKTGSVSIILFAREITRELDFDWGVGER